MLEGTLLICPSGFIKTMLTVSCIVMLRSDMVRVKSPTGAAVLVWYTFVTDKEDVALLTTD
jgi:hypothetical protein